MDNILFSVVSPVYKGEKIVSELVNRIKRTLSSITESFEIILVNDASPDDSWQMILQECESDIRVKGINLSRNFGQHYAITAGLHFVKGKWIVVMDCDLQDQPEEILNLYNKACKGYDIVLAQRLERKDTFLKRTSSMLFHSVFHYFSGIKTDKSVANFGIYNILVIQEFNKMPEKARSFPTLITYLGFRTATIPVQHACRYEGKSSYSLRRLLVLSFDVIISNSNKPLRMTVLCGITISLISFLLAFYNLVAYLSGIIRLPGFTTTIFSIWFVGGLLMFQIGILGIYLGKIFDQVKNRPLYVISHKVNI